MNRLKELKDAVNEIDKAFVNARCICTFDMPIDTFNLSTDLGLNRASDYDSKNRLKMLDYSLRNLETLNKVWGNAVIRLALEQYKAKISELKAASCKDSNEAYEILFGGTQGEDKFKDEVNTISLQLLALAEKGMMN